MFSFKSRFTIVVLPAASSPLPRVNSAPRQLLRPYSIKILISLSLRRAFLRTDNISYGRDFVEVDDFGSVDTPF